MILWVIMCLVTAMGALLAVFNAMPVGDDADVSHRVNKQTFSKAIDYALDKLVFESAAENEGKISVKTGCYRIGRFIGNSTNSGEKNNFDTIKLEFIDNENNCNPRNFTDAQKQKFGNINRENGGLAMFVEDGGGFEAHANDAMLMITKEEFKKGFSSSVPNGDNGDVEIYTATLYQVGDPGSGEVRKVYEFVGGRNS